MYGGKEAIAEDPTKEAAIHCYPTNVLGGGAIVLGGEVTS